MATRPEHIRTGAPSVECIVFESTRSPGNILVAALLQLKYILFVLNFVFLCYRLEAM